MKRLSGLVVGLVALAFAGAAPAATVTINIETLLAGGDRSVVCDGLGCQGFYDSLYNDAVVSSSYTAFGDLELSDDRATAWNLRPSDEVTVWGFLNNMLAALPEDRDPVEFSTVRKFDGDFEAGLTFETRQEYFWIKQGVWTAFFVNPNPGQLLAVRVIGGDISNYGVAGVPIPAAFILFGSGLVGLGWLARRQRARKEESVA